MSMDPMPHLPESFHAPVALVLEGHELNAITDAILIFDLMVDGCLADALALVDQTDDGGYTRSVLNTLMGVREKVEKANEPRRREVRRWIEQMNEWRDQQNGEDPE